MSSSKRGRSSELPQEILASEVLPRLPPKSLLRFRNVCKAWRDLISSPAFIEAQLLQQQSQRASISNDGAIISSPQQLNLIARYKYAFSVCSIVVGSVYAKAETRLRSYYSPLLDSLYEDADIYPRLWNSCNGLICVEIDDDDELCLWNPCTQSLKTLPHWNGSEDEDDDDSSGDFTLTYGFGYDAKIKDYKVVRIGKKKVGGDRVLETHVFTMGTNSWRRILGNEEFSSEVPGKFVNGFVYWKAMYDRRNEVFCFDIHGEVFSELRLPRVVLTDDTDKIICNIEIGELGGCLALVREFADRFHTPHVYHEVWVMKENWVKMHSIDISESVWTKFPTPFVPVGSVSINKKKKYVEIVYLSSNGRLFSYNPNTNRFRSFRGHGYCNLHRAVAPYVESLVLLDGKYINEEKHVS